jgi:hypothetical protein
MLPRIDRRVHSTRRGREWICPNSEEVLNKAGVLTIEEYIKRRREMIMTYTQNTSIYGKCKSSRKIASNLLWWEVNYYRDDAAEALAVNETIRGEVGS